MHNKISAALVSVAILSLFAIVIDASDNYTVDSGANVNITVHAECRKVTNSSATGASVYVPTETYAEWQSFYVNPPAGVTAGGCTVPITITTGSNRNLCTLAGDPTTPGDYVFTINAGTTINSTSNATPALTTGTCWPVGSTVTVLNNGNIYGKGGNGGAGGSSGAGGAGGAGGMAIQLSYPITIDNTGGQIFGGGGGGGGGGACYTYTRGVNFYRVGGGGGGGQSSPNSSGGTAGQGTQGMPDASPGTAGTASTRGTGGDGYIVGTYGGGDGGNGGTWGTAGSAGAKAVGQCMVTAYSGGAGGAAGKAIDTNGHAVTWIAGNTSAKVKGAVSN